MPINSLLKTIKSNNFSILSFSKKLTGNYSKLDSDWNYKDVPHLKHVHKLVDPIHIKIGNKYSSTLALQKIFFITLPLPIFIFEDEPFSLIYYTVFGPYVIFVHTTITQETSSTTTITTYHICSINKFFSIFSPLIKFLLNRNYNILMADDSAMRERKGYLRSLGYDFFLNGSTYDFDKTQNIFKSNVIPNFYPHNSVFHLNKFSEAIINAQLRTYIGDSDYYGIFYILENDEVIFYQRMCHHEGACLDNAINNHDKLSCPWHGKSIKPIFKSPHKDLIQFYSNNLFYEVNLLEKTCKVTVSKI
jgi:hypothetical protein